MHVHASKVFLTLILASIGVFGISGLHAQELRCKVTVNSNQIPQVDRSIFDALETGITEFMNSTNWTSDVYEEFEKIECQIFINVTEQEKDPSGKLVADAYRGTITIIAQRRIYETTYDSPLLNHQDQDFTFSYIPYQQFLWAENSAQANLTSVLGFYAYLIIGLDMDSFSPEGGTDILNKALNVINNSQNLGDRGWRAMEGKQNRYWIINDYLNSAFKALREIYYAYHRQGLDIMLGDEKKGREGVIAAIKRLEEVWDQRPNAFLLQIFFNAKRNEILQFMGSLTPPERMELVPVLKKVDPAQGSRYESIR